MTDRLIPAIAQDAKTGEVLMLAYMNDEALAKTRETGKAHYWSRSRKKLWLKGESSGHFQRVLEIRIDCDEDAVLSADRARGRCVPYRLQVLLLSHPGRQYRGREGL